MSKSYNNTLELFESAAAQRKKIMRITTDSRPMEEPKEPDGHHLFQLYSLFASEAERADMAALYRRGGFGYGEVKKALAEQAEKFFAEPRARRAEFEANPRRVTEILADGASRARKKAAEVLQRAKKGMWSRLLSPRAMRHQPEKPAILFAGDSPCDRRMVRRSRLGLPRARKSSSFHETRRPVARRFSLTA